MIEKDIYLTAIGKSERKRPIFVQAVCDGSNELRSVVDSLIRTHEDLHGKCDGQTVSLVLNRHKHEFLSDRSEPVVPPIEKLEKETTSSRDAETRVIQSHQRWE